MHRSPSMIDDRTLPEGGDGGRFRDLLARRDRLRGWLARLADESDVSPAVAERVRADYLDQLEGVMRQLSEHQDELRERRAELESGIAMAATASSEAREALEEAELRFRIGELDTADWEARRAELEPEATGAAGRLEELRSEAQDLDLVMDEVGRWLSSDDETLPVLGEPGGPADSISDPVELGRNDASPPAAAADGDDGGASPFEDGAGITRPAPGVKCVECGYTNDFGALYCGVCGVELS